MSYYDLIKPDLVLVMYTFPHRREIYTENGGIEPFIPTHSWGYLEETKEGQHIQNSLDILQNNNSDFINWYKNHMLIKLFLENKNCNWLWNGNNLKTEYTEFNRFDGVIMKHIDKGSDNMHPGPQHHKHYSIRLFEHIKKNFRNYLPDNLNEVTRSLI
jgi:hypothetical protein